MYLKIPLPPYLRLKTPGTYVDKDSIPQQSSGDDDKDIDNEGTCTRSYSLMKKHSNNYSCIISSNGS